MFYPLDAPVIWILSHLFMKIFVKINHKNMLFFFTKNHWSMFFVCNLKPWVHLNICPEIKILSYMCTSFFEKSSRQGFFSFLTKIFFTPKWQNGETYYIPMTLKISTSINIYHLTCKVWLVFKNKFLNCCRKMSTPLKQSEIYEQSCLPGRVYEDETMFSYF